MSKIYVTESFEHLQGKKLLQNLYKNNVLEEYRVNSKQRADLFLPKQSIIEIQCSNITYQCLLNRHLGYKNLGYDDYWILGTRYTKKSAKMFYCYNSKLGFYCYRLSKDLKNLLCHYHLESSRCYYIKMLDLNVNNLNMIDDCDFININQNYFSKEFYAFRYYKGDYLKIKNHWYQLQIDINKYLKYLVIPINFVFWNKYDEFLLKSQYIWSMMDIEYKDQYNHRFVFIDKQMYLDEFSKIYSRCLKHYF